MAIGIEGFNGRRLTEVREARGLTITSLVEKLDDDVSVASVSQYEKGTASPRPQVAEQLAKNESKIVEELRQAAGKPVDIGGYYHPDPAKTSKAMRPSATFNTILDSIRV